jgi:hypothetical protein
MKPIILLTLLLAGFLHTIFGQTNNTNNAVTGLTKIDIGLQGIGFSYEPKISDKLTIDLCAGVGGGYKIEENDFAYKVLQPAAYFSATPKYFYNFQKKINKGKNTKFNSGDYFGLRLKYVTPLKGNNDETRNGVLTNIHWGMQRAIGGNWLFNLHLGVGYATDLKYGGIVYPAIDFKFAYILSKPGR